MKSLISVALIALSFSSFAQTSREVRLGYGQIATPLKVVAATIVVSGRRSEVKATVTYSNACVAAGQSNVVYSSRANGSRLTVSLLALADTTGPRACTMQYAPVAITYVLPVNVFGADDRGMEVSVNGVPAMLQ